MVAGTSTALSTSEPMIQALTRAPGGLSAVGDKVGMASDFKLINQVYCAIQICVTGYVVSQPLFRSQLNDQREYGIRQGVGAESSYDLQCHSHM